MTEEWLIKQFSRSEVDAELGMQNQRWMEFRVEIQNGDELWQFCSPKNFWKNRCGRAGFSIVSDGEIYRSLVTMLN